MATLPRDQQCRTGRHQAFLTNSDFSFIAPMPLILNYMLMIKLLIDNFHDSQNAKNHHSKKTKSLADIWISSIKSIYS